MTVQTVPPTKDYKDRQDDRIIGIDATLAVRFLNRPNGFAATSRTVWPSPLCHSATEPPRATPRCRSCDRSLFFTMSTKRTWASWGVIEVSRKSWMKRSLNWLFVSLGVQHVDAWQSAVRRQDPSPLDHRR